MPAVLSPNPKKQSVFIDKYGNIKEGSFFEQSNNFGHNLGTVAKTDRPSENGGTAEEVKSE